MNLNKEQIGMAVKAGLTLLAPESDVKIPTALNDGVFFLKALLSGIAQGKISLGAAVQEPPPPSTDTPPPNPPNRKVRRAVAKATKGRAAKKKAVKKVAARRKESRKKK